MTPHAARDQLCQRCDIAKSEVEALAGNRMQLMRGVADAQGARAGALIAGRQTERKARARGHCVKAAQAPTERALQRVQKIALGRRRESLWIPHRIPFPP